MSEFPSSLEVEGGPPPRLEWRRYQWRPNTGPLFSEWCLVWQEFQGITARALDEFRALAVRLEIEPPHSSGLDARPWSVQHRVEHVEGMSVSECPGCCSMSPRLDDATYCRLCAVQCDACEQYIDPDDALYVDSTEHSNDAHYCSCCIGSCSRSSCVNLCHPDESVCPSCEQRSVVCDQCDDYEDRDRVELVGDNYVCEDCLERHYYRCDQCDEYEFRRHVRDGVCRECRESDDYLPSSGIHSYTYKPRPIFFASLGDSTPFFGLEIEVEAVHDESSPERGAELARRHCSDLIYCKSDRSLNNGVELVTHPMSLEYLQRCDSLEALLESLGAEGFRAWKTTTCGLHVHISRAAFHSSSHAFRFALFHYRNAEQVAQFSGRTTRALNDYARLTHHQGNGDDWPRLSQKIRHQGNISVERYTAVNLANSSTLEVRVFRGTLSFSSIVGNVEYLHALWAFTWSLSSHDVLEGRLSWSSLVEWVRSDKTRAALYGRFLDLEARRFARVSA